MGSEHETQFSPHSPLLGACLLFTWAWLLCRYCCSSEITEVTVRPPCSGFPCLVCGGFPFQWGRGCGLTVHLVPSAQPLTLSSGDTERTVSISSPVLCGVGHLLLGQWVSRGRHGGRHSLFAPHPPPPFLPSGILLISGSCGQERTVLAADVESKLVTSNMLRLQTWALVISIKQIRAVSRSWGELGSQPGPRRCGNCPRFSQF